MPLRLPELKQVGDCSGCKQSFTLSSVDWLIYWVPKHPSTNRKKGCPGSMMSPLNRRSVIENSTEANRVAEFVRDDDGRCLTNTIGHSMACGDGEHCSQSRLELAKALADYYLKTCVEKVSTA